MIMKSLMSFLVVFTTLATAPALADPCVDRFKAFLQKPPATEPSVGLITQRFGTTETVNEYLSLSPEHGMYKPVKPATGDWILTYQGGMYQSGDAGKSWKKVHSFDPVESAQAARAQSKADAEAATDVLCGEDTVDGVTYMTFEATLPQPGLPGQTTRNRYWLEPATGYAARALFKSKLSGMETEIYQQWSRQPDLKLPTP